MKRIVAKAYAKINLSIDVLGKREDGYHEVCMVMQQIDLWDRITVTLKDGFSPKAVSVTADTDTVPLDNNNLAYKAARLMMSRYCEREGDSIGIHLEKRIPVAAGLAGGSADGAAVLHALNKLWDLDLSLQELMELGVKLGADVPFCIMGQAAVNNESGFDKNQVSTCALACGIGEKLAPLPPIDAWVVLSKPPVRVSTAEVYGALTIRDINKRPDTENLILGLKEKDFNRIQKSMFNVLEPVSSRKFPEIADAKKRMEQNKELYSGQFKVLMSGSGPTVFAVTPKKEVAELIYNDLKEINPTAFLVKTI